MCAFVADFMANIARVLLKYIPMLLCNFDVVHKLESYIVEDIYDCIDMIIETFFYIPTIFACNYLSLSVLHFRYLKSKNRKEIEYLKQLKKDNINGGIWKTQTQWKYNVNPLPGVNELRNEWCNVGDKMRKIVAFYKILETMLVHQRIMAEFNMSLVTLFDQIFDAFGVLFYLLFWGASNDWINISESKALLIYDIFWELGTTNQPYLIMIICPQVRNAFFKLYLSKFAKFKNKLSNLCFSTKSFCIFNDSSYLSP
uniref:Gustatory receptor n=1 Tax=Panagrolaimus sp. PS1159 TaxID=55785 RepID=A0AC35EYF0_9BILA